MTDNFIFRGSVAHVDPELKALLDREDARQSSTIILIASESESPESVSEALMSSFANIYAEGYPREESRRQTQDEILDLDMELAHYRRYGDPRYYKGVEYADQLEALTRRRAAELFAANGISPDKLWVNVQPLSGAPANSAVYTALLQPGDTIMGLNLNDGGHLSHGSSVNRSGKIYKSAPYFVNPETELLDYDAIEKQALEIRPKILVAGYSAYPRVIDWARFRKIADACGAYLLADIAHISGLVASGVHPSPIGIADIVSTTTHKSLCGPRGAMLMTHRADIGKKIDRAVFPGEQGGPHLNTIAALAVALKLARTDKFRALQQRIVENASRLAEQLQKHGLRIVSGGSENHLLLVDTKSVRNGDVTLGGDLAARILDVAGIVVNRNTIPGDKGALNPSGLRLGTVWISQLGFGPKEVDLLAEAIATVLKGCVPYTTMALGGKDLPRARVDYAALQRGREIVRQLRGVPAPKPAGNAVHIRGAAANNFLDYALASDVAALNGDGDEQPTYVYGPNFEAAGVVRRVSFSQYVLTFAGPAVAQQVADWFNALSDGYAQFDDTYAKLPGPIVATVIPADGTPTLDPAAGVASGKPYFIGCRKGATSAALPAFSWQEPPEGELKVTKLHETHKALGARMVPFGGYDMPVWYTGVSEEHAAVRQTAGLFDVSHMGVFDVRGPHASDLLNIVTSNDVTALEVGESHYSYFMLPDGSVVDDLMVYRRGTEDFMLVVNASNNDKDWAWINAVNEGKVMIDAARPWVRVQHPAEIRDLRDPRHGHDCRVDIALQGPRSTDIMLALAGDDAGVAKRLKALPWAGVMLATVGGFNLVISRTGYTGERVAYELFIHPDRAVEFWNALMKAGEPFGLKPCGLASRDSTRTEAGLPLYGHELAGHFGLNPAEAGFGSYVKLWKPFFIGREAFVAHEQKRDRIVVRFRMNEKGVRRPETGDPVLDKRGKIVGTVTSCAIDTEGYLLGQAVVPETLSQPGNALFVYQLGGGTRPLKAPDKVEVGGKMPLPDAATVQTRFPERKKA